MKALISEIKVGLNFGDKIQPVGRLAIRDSIIYFEYNNDFVQRGLTNIVCYGGLVDRN